MPAGEMVPVIPLASRADHISDDTVEQLGSEPRRYGLGVCGPSFLWLLLFVCICHSGVPIPACTHPESSRRASLDA